MGSERRRATRQDMRWKGLMLDTSGTILGRCMMVNVSATGAKLIVPEPTELPDNLVLILAKNGEVRRLCEVTWRREKSIGVRFSRPASVEEEELSYVDEALARMAPGH